MEHSVDPVVNPAEPANRWERLAAYLLGGVSRAERIEMERWMASDPELQASVAQIREMHPPERAPVDVERALGVVAGRLRAGGSSQDEKPRTRHSTPASRTLGIRTPRIAMILAGAGACIAVAMALLMPAKPNVSRDLTYHTALAERATVTLADGSQVMLAPDSRITLEEGFGDRTRTLTLSGEAFFVVRNTSGVPFIVRSADVQTRVLGTEFGVRAYATDTAVRVAVTSGKVEAEGPEQSLTLTAGTVGEFTDSTVESSRVSDMSSYVGWTDGQLVFENVAAAKMLATIGRWYGYTFRVPDSTLAERRFSAVFSVSERVETMQLLERLLNVNMQVTGDAVIVHPRPVRRGTPPPRRMDHDVYSPSAEVGK